MIAPGSVVNADRAGLYTLHACWERDSNLPNPGKVDIKFKPGKGSYKNPRHGTMNSISIEFGKEFVVPACQFTVDPKFDTDSHGEWSKREYTFGHWNLSGIDDKYYSIFDQNGKKLDSCARIKPGYKIVIDPNYNPYDTPDNPPTLRAMWDSDSKRIFQRVTYMMPMGHREMRRLLTTMTTTKRKKAWT